MRVFIKSGIVLSALVVLVGSVQADFWHVKDQQGNTACFLADMRSEGKNPWDTFHKNIFTMPEFLNQATEYQHPVIFLVPQELDGLGPLDEQSCFIESVRTALAWARAYYQTIPDRYDMRIITLSSHDTSAWSELVAYALACPKVDTTTDMEEAVRRSVYAYEAQQNNAQSSHYTRIALPSIPQEEPIKTIILPWLQRVGKRYLVAGGAGFIGRHLVQRLLDQGNQVLALDNFRCSVPENIAEFLDNPNFCIVEQDVTKPFIIKGALDVIIHLASLPSPQYYYTMPRETLLTGLQGTKNLIELAKAHNARFLFTSTSEVYGDPEVHPQPEDYPGNTNCLGKRSQYDQSKRGGETLLKLYFDHYKLDIRIVRLFNTYGPFMMLHDGRVITNFIAALLENKPLTIYGDGNQTRSFAYIDDTVEGIMKVLEYTPNAQDTNIASRVFNIGNQDEFTINELAEKAIQLSQNRLKRQVGIMHVPQPDITDPKMRRPDITRAASQLGFTLTVPLDQGFLKTFDYFYTLMKS